MIIHSTARTQFLGQEILVNSILVFHNKVFCCIDENQCQLNFAYN